MDGKMTAQEYYISEGLKQLIEQAEKSVAVGEVSLAPQVEDLVRIHRFIRSRRSFTVLEFGVGYSTLVIADALMKNRNDWQNLASKPSLRNSQLFKCYTVDTSKDWVEKTRKRLPENLQGIVIFSISKVKIGTFNGQLCHFYEQLPDVVPDFIYLDGPDPKAVEGSVNGLSFACPERTVMAADLLLMEPTLLPGTFILIDGRTNNVRFLSNNFRRTFDFQWNKAEDFSTFELTEPRLGKYNVLGSDFY